LTDRGSGPYVREGAIGELPCLIAGDGLPLVVLAGLSPDAGVSPGPMRRVLNAGRLTADPVGPAGSA
jgi:hypothetical protein